MNIVEHIRYAPEWLQKCTADFDEFIPEAVAIIRIYEDIDEKEYPSLRDRTDDYTRMVASLVSVDPVFVKTREYRGRDLRQFGYDPKGAQNSHLFKVLVA